MKVVQKGMLLIISGPSGVGKGTLLDRLMKEDPSFQFSCSVTTRAPRTGEIEGVHYHFITEEQYDELLNQDAFLEHASVHGHRYGTLKQPVEKALSEGKNIVLDIDQQGAISVMEHAESYVSVFILPPSYKALRERLEGRRTDSAADIERRLQNAKGEIEKLPRYQYCIVNEDLDTAFCQLKSIVTAEKQRTFRYIPILDD